MQAVLTGRLQKVKKKKAKQNKTKQERMPFLAVMLTYYGVTPGSGHFEPCCDLYWELQDKYEIVKFVKTWN